MTGSVGGARPVGGGDVYDDAQTRRNIALAATLASAEVGSRAYEQAARDLLEHNKRAIQLVVRRIVRLNEFRMYNAEEVRSVIQSGFVLKIDRWDPKDGPVPMWLFFLARAEMRSHREQQLGYGGAVSAFRRWKRYLLFWDRLEAERGAAATTAEVVEYANEMARVAYANPVKNGVILTVEEIEHSRWLFGRSPDSDATYEVDFASHVDDLSTQVISGLESTAFISDLVESIRDAGGDEAAQVLIARFNLDAEDPDLVGTISSYDKVVEATGISKARVRGFITLITRFTGEMAREIST